jgi:hypothetical protein
MALTSGDDRNMLDQRFSGTIIVMSRSSKHINLRQNSASPCVPAPLGPLYHGQRFQWFVVFPQIKGIQFIHRHTNQSDGIRIDIMNAIKIEPEIQDLRHESICCPYRKPEAISANPFPSSFGCCERSWVSDSNNWHGKRQPSVLGLFSSCPIGAHHGTTAVWWGG